MPAQKAHFFLRSMAAIVVLFVPGVVLGFTGWSAESVFLFIGLIPALVSMLHGSRTAIVVSGYTAVVVYVTQLASAHAAVAVVVMVAIGVIVGVSATRGLQSAAVISAAWPAVLLLEPAIRLPGISWLQTPGAAALTAAAFTLGGGLFTVAVTRVIVPDIPRSEPSRLGNRTSIVYGATLACVLGLATAFLVTWDDGGLGGWILLTILVIGRPSLTETRQRLIGRSVGTAAGGAAALLVVLVVPLGGVLTALGLVALAAAILLQLRKAPYAMYSVALTAAVVLLDSRGGSRLRLDVERVGYTLAGAAVATVVLVILELFAARARSRNAPARP